MTQREQRLQWDLTLLTELKRRSAAYRSGQTTSRPAKEVLAGLRQRQADEKAILKNDDDKEP